MNDGCTKKLFCFGFGYSCEYLAHTLLSNSASDWTISGTTRSEDKMEDMRNRSIQGYIFDYLKPLSDPLQILENVTHLLISTPPDDEGDPTFLIHSEDIAHLKNLKWIGYLSTNAVYGDRGGAWVDENSELRPTSKRGSRRVRAEEQWMSLYKQYNMPVHIFRLAGIYGPGRSAIDSVRAGIARRINKPGHMFGRIHAEDIAHVLAASMRAPSPSAVYNICDGHPVPSHEVIEYACELLGRPVPPMVSFEEANLEPMTRSFYMDNRKVRNDKILQEFGKDIIKYPTYREGLRACLAVEEILFEERQKQIRSPFAK